jgi:hypothetical protein
MLEFYWVFVRTGIPHEHVVRGQSVRTGTVPQLGYMPGAYTGSPGSPGSFLCRSLLNLILAIVDSGTEESALAVQ